MANLVLYHVFVSGKVQGVGYRFATLQSARRLGVQGWVRNLPDGRVEAVFEAEKQKVETIVSWCYTGSDAAIVRNVEVSIEPPRGLQGFEIRP